MKLIRNNKKITALSVSVAASLVAAGVAGAEEVAAVPASAVLHYGSGNDRIRVELAPNYSEELGWSLRGAAGAYLTDAVALGLIVEYGENKREYLGNAGVQFTDSLSLVGTVGLLEEDLKFEEVLSRETVRQMEYGASLKGAYELSFITGWELNGYLTNADANNDGVETGKLYGLQLMADLDLTSTTHFKVGGGYEWLRWDSGDDSDRFAFSADLAQQLGDMLSLTGNVKLGASEYVYGGGLALDLSRGRPNTNRVGLDYMYIDGRDGVQDDQRVALSWSMGFGAGPAIETAGAAITDKSGTIHAAADVALLAPANNLLSEVTKRPAYLPQQVIARSRYKGFDESGPCSHDNFLKDPESFEYEEVGVWYITDGKVYIDTYYDEYPNGYGKFDLFVSSNNTPPPQGLTPFKAGVVINDATDNEPIFDAGNLDQYEQAFWAFTDDSGQCKAIYWGED